MSSSKKQDPDNKNLSKVVPKSKVKIVSSKYAQSQIISKDISQTQNKIKGNSTKHVPAQLATTTTRIDNKDISKKKIKETKKVVASKIGSLNVSNDKRNIHAEIETMRSLYYQLSFIEAKYQKVFQIQQEKVQKEIIEATEYLLSKQDEVFHMQRYVNSTERKNEVDKNLHTLLEGNPIEKLENVIEQSCSNAHTLSEFLQRTKSLVKKPTDCSTVQEVENCLEGMKNMLVECSNVLKPETQAKIEESAKYASQIQKHTESTLEELKKKSELIDEFYNRKQKEISEKIHEIQQHRFNTQQTPL